METADSWGIKGGDASPLPSRAIRKATSSGRTTSKQSSQWFVRRSTNGGDTWTHLGSPIPADTTTGSMAWPWMGRTPSGGGVQALNSPNQSWVMQRWNSSTVGAGRPTILTTVRNTARLRGEWSVVDPTSGNVYVTER